MTNEGILEGSAPANTVPFAPLPRAEHSLGPLVDLVGTWEGTGFNTIWRPSFGRGTDRFLEINRTKETLVFTEIKGMIPNRGLLQDDILIRGLTYVQQVTDLNMNVTIHMETGMWAVVPATTNPQVDQTVIRMASIPHGTALLAQGTAVTSDGAPSIPEADLLPFFIGNPTSKASLAPSFEELLLSASSDSHSPSEQLVGVNQETLDNPTTVLKAALVGQEILKTTTLLVTTTCDPTPGGGLANTAFLQGSPSQPNAKASEVKATFWIETIKGEPDALQLQYVQTVLLDFNRLSWPHVSVGTLRKKAA